MFQPDLSGQNGNIANVLKRASLRKKWRRRAEEAARQKGGNGPGFGDGSGRFLPIVAKG